MDDRVTCADCRHYGRAPHAKRETRADYQLFFRLPSYRPPMGCRLTGEHLAPRLLRRCETFEVGPGVAA